MTRQPLIYKNAKRNFCSGGVFIWALLIQLTSVLISSQAQGVATFKLANDVDTGVTIQQSSLRQDLNTTSKWAHYAAGTEYTFPYYLLRGSDTLQVQFHPNPRVQIITETGEKLEPPHYRYVSVGDEPANITRAQLQRIQTDVSDLKETVRLLMDAVGTVNGTVHRLIKTVLENGPDPK